MAEKKSDGRIFFFNIGDPIECEKMPFISFVFLIALARLPNTMLKRSGVDLHC